MSQKKKYSKEQIASKVGVQPYMIATWEKQFEITPIISQGQSIYTKRQLATFRAIKELLYDKGLTPDAAKKQLAQEPLSEESSAEQFSLFFIPTRKTASLTVTPEPLQIVPSTATSSPKSTLSHQHVAAELRKIKEQLIQLSKRL